MNKEKLVLTSLKDIKGTDQNPFMFTLKEKMFLQPRANTIIAKGQQIIDTETGQVIDESMLIGRRKIVDKSQFAKIYASEILALFDLSKAALNVFLYLAKVMDYENKALLIYLTEHEKIGYKSADPVLKGLRELISHNIIFPHVATGFWWLNPAYICKGERFAKYTEYVTEDYARGQKEAMLKKQQKEQMELIDIATDGKLSEANRQPSINSHNEGTIPFPDESPFK